jgi:hypothetical protein
MACNPEALKHVPLFALLDAESEIQGLARKLNLLGDQMADVEDLLRKRLS